MDAFVATFVEDDLYFGSFKQMTLRAACVQVTAISDYYIIAGVIYQAPDLGSVLNSRILTGVGHLQKAFEEAREYSRYHPSRGYWWDFGKEKEEKKKEKVKEKKKEEPSSVFQRRRVDMLLDQLTRQYPHKLATPAALPGPAPPPAAAESEPALSVISIKSETKSEAKREKPSGDSGGGGASKKIKTER